MHTYKKFLMVSLMACLIAPRVLVGMGDRRLLRDAWQALAKATVAGGCQVPFDDYDDDAGLLEIDFHYEIESFGSDTEYE